MGTITHISVGTELSRDSWEATDAHSIGGETAQSIVRSTTLVVAANDAPTHVKAQADYTCDGTADDVQIQAAIDALPATGGSVDITLGTFVIATALAIPSNVTLKGQGNSTILQRPTAGTIIGITGTSLAISDLSADGDVTDQTISLVDASSLSAGDWINITSTKVVSGSQVQGEIRRIASIATNDVTLDCPDSITGLWDTYLTSNTATVNKITPVENVTICDMMLDGVTNTNSTYGIVSTFGNNIKVENVYIKDVGYAEVLFQSTVNSSISNSVFETPNMTGVGYGISLSNANSSIVIVNNQFIKTRGHSVTTGGNGGEGISRFIVIDGNLFYGSKSTAFRDHVFMSDFVTISNNIFSSCIQGMSMAGNNFIVTGNQFMNIGATYAAVNISMNDDVSGVISNNLVVNAPYVVNGAMNDGSNLIISNNVGLGITTYPIDLNETTGDTAAYLGITGNSFSGSYSNPIRLTRDGTGTFSVVRITDNDIPDGSVGGISVESAVTQIIRDNNGYVTENSGTATVLNTATTVVVTHGLTTTPTRIQITPRENPTNAVAFWWVDTLTTTQFTINVNADPGASNLDFDWHAQVGEG